MTAEPSADREPPKAIQATAARTVLADCEYLLAELQANPQGQAWRVRWAGVVVLLRSVGHVLDNVDCDANGVPELRDAAANWWKSIDASKPEPAIFWQFIRKQRNEIVKEYRFAARQEIRRGGWFGSAWFAPSYFGSGHFGPPPGPIYPITDGPFTGRDQRDLVSEAIAWWRVQLSGIEAEAAAASRGEA